MRARQRHPIYFAIGFMLGISVVLPIVIDVLFAVIGWTMMLLVEHAPAPVLDDFKTLHERYRDP